MSGVEIERLVLSLPAMPPHDARRLALMVAAGIAAAEGIGSIGDLPALRVGVDMAKPGEPADALAGRIVAAAVRQLRRSP
ncbi:MAG TPA: hypothetical protein VFX06_09310 [Stellaceae bacterium]|nr:hypothetical protein [Stellaceae bacterium]